MVIKSFLTSFILFLLINDAFAQKQDHLRLKIASIAEEANGRVGVAMMCMEDGDTLSYNGHQHQVLQSVMKFPIGVAVLHLVEDGQLKLDQKIHIDKADLPKNFSPLRERYPEGNIDLSIAELLNDMVSLSDNNVCDIFLNKIISKKEVEKYMQHIGIRAISIKATEAEMGKYWITQYDNWAEPVAVLKLLEIVYKGNILSSRNKALLMKMMQETPTTPKRLKGLLPEGTPVAHKSGTSYTNQKGLSAATNDVGIITMPNGKHLAIVVMITDSFANKEVREGVIARIAKAAYDDFNK